MDTEKYPSLQAGEPGEPVGVSLTEGRREDVPVQQRCRKGIARATLS